MDKLALVIEDVREVCSIITRWGYHCDRITHTELLSYLGEEYLGKILHGDYSLLWISTPADWYVRLPGKRTTPHWQRVQLWITKAHRLQVSVVLFGPPGHMWKIPSIIDTIRDLPLNATKMRLCHFGEKYSTSSNVPSGSYLQVATSLPLPTTIWRCRCTITIQNHNLDWYGQTSDHAEWRRRVRYRLLHQLSLIHI